MGLSRRKFTKEMKVAAIQRLEAGSSVAEVARAFEVNPNLLHRWRKEFRHGPGNAFPGGGKRRWDETKVAQLERKVGQQTLEIDFLKGCLQRIEEQRMLQALTGKPRPAGTSKSQIEKGSQMTILRMCELGQVSRAAFYRFDPRPEHARRGSGSAGRHPAHRSGVSLLWPAADHRRAEAAGLGGEPQAGGPHHARGQSALPAAAEVRGDHRFQSRSPRVSQPGQGAWH